MSFFKLNCYCGNDYTNLIVDTEKTGIIGVVIPAHLSGYKIDVEIMVDVQPSYIDFLGCSKNYRIGDSFDIGTYVELNWKGCPITVVITDMERGFDCYVFNGANPLSVGPSSEHTIVYGLEAKESLSRSSYFTLTNDPSHSRALFETGTSHAPVYINDIKTMAASPVYFGDEISVLGLTLVYLGDAFAVQSQKNILAVNAAGYDSESFPIAIAKEGISFSRTTRIYSTEEKSDVLIDSPQAGSVSEEMPAALTVGPMITMGVSMAASMAMNISNSGNISSFIMSGSMLAGLILWPTLSRKWEKKRQAEREEFRVKNYSAYLASIEQIIVESATRSKTTMNDTKSGVSEIYSWIGNNNLRRIWERSHYDDDFAELRLGSGAVRNPARIDAPRLTYQNDGDTLLTKAIALKEKYQWIPDSPITVDLKDSNSIGLIGMEALVRNAAQSMIFQLAALHDSSEVKIAVIYSEASTEFDWVKKLPHIWNDDMDFRFIAQNKSESQTLFRFLLEEMELRKGHNDTPLPAYVIFVIDKALTADVSLTSFIHAPYKTSGFASVYAFCDIQNIPNGCKTLVQFSADRTAIYDHSSCERGFRPFERETVTPAEVRLLADTFSGFKSSSGSGKAGIPATVTFLDLFKAGKVEDINVLKFWAMSNPQKSLAVPIGIKSGGEFFYLDIHEKYHGSHGLMAGTTGSGKSECIQTVILSLAAYFHPDDISFVLIDFKGGGMANSFIGLPHLAGTITNLGNQIKRSMTSLNAELKNRQNMLKEAGVNHIDKYQKMFKDGETAKPMPHLVIISDEFAELKQQNPEFMAELISVARIGRSLGVHLILATQKPTGVVDDQIWSNTRFRVSLKVADKSDSMSMIDSPLAAAITLPGRAYIQVGYNEVFEQLQTGYTGADYIPSDEYIQQDVQQVLEIDSCAQITGQATRKANAAQEVKKLSQLEAMVGYLNCVARQNRIDSHPIWADPLPYLIALDEIDGFAKATETNEVVCVAGQIDDPEMQVIRPLQVTLSDGHIVLYGMPGSGKTTFVQTLLYSLTRTYATSMLQFEIIDYGGRTLDIFLNAPHTRDVFFPNNEEEITALLQDLLEEIEMRREKFAAARQETLPMYLKSTGEQMPVILVLVEHYGRFSDEASDNLDILTEIIKEGAKYGVIVMVTVNSVNNLPYRLNDYFTEKIMLQLGDSLDYASVLGSASGMKPEPVKGRGLIKYDGRILEFQTALAFKDTDDGIRSEMIVNSLKDMFGDVSKKGGVVPVSHRKLNVVAKKDNSGSVHTSSGGLPGIGSNTNQTRRKSGGLGALPGFGIKNKSSSKTSKLMLNEFNSDEDNGVILGGDRLGRKKYALHFGKSLYVLGQDGSAARVIAACAKSQGFRGETAIKPFYFGIGEIPDHYVRVSAESDITEAVNSMNDGKTVFFIEDMMEFYKAIRDKDLDTLITVLSDEVKGNSFIIGANINDAVVLRDYPLGIFLFTTNAAGMLAGCKASDALSILHTALLDNMTAAERASVVTASMPLLFQKNGANSRIVINDVEV